ncbi:unnamed protein product [Staurois parvus]|uniref:Uncharacterized protein n=1 Tax=Staurois parvus TaxID=386267 RepID=A0ABN9B1C0_9NEOB|nr:unnamed protein product [Staurois parvus]
MPPISGSQCHLSVLPVSVTYQCASVPPNSASQFAYQCQSVLPISVMYQCWLSVPISDACQCPSVQPTSASS